MNVGRLIFVSISSITLLSSCATQQEVVQNNHDSREYYCGQYYARNYEQHQVQEERIYHRQSWIALEMVVKDGDTLDLKELICVDSAKFTQELSQFKVRDMCVEMGIQGNTIFVAKTNKYGGFEEVSVARSVDQCFHDLENKIKEKVLTMRIVPENAGTYEVVFYHYFRLD